MTWNNEKEEENAKKQTGISDFDWEWLYDAVCIATVDSKFYNDRKEQRTDKWWTLLKICVIRKLHQINPSPQAMLDSLVIDDIMLDNDVTDMMSQIIYPKEYQQHKELSQKTQEYGGDFNAFDKAGQELGMW